MASNIQVQDALSTISLDSTRKKIITLRVKGLLAEYYRRSFRYSVTYNTLRVTITVGSLIVPALLSVQYTSSPGNPSASANQVYWSVWILSLLVTISNGIVALLKVDKKYFVLNTTYQHIISETWQYIELSGKYSGFYTPNEQTTHDNQYKYFCHTLEKIRMKQVEDEYYKITDHIPAAHGTADSLIPPTPLKGILSETQKNPLVESPFDAPGEKTPLEVNGDHPITIRKTTEENKKARAPFQIRVNNE